MSPFVRPPLIRLGDRLSARSVFFVLLGVFTVTMSGLPEDLASELDFQTTRSLARGTLVLGDTPEARAVTAQRSDVVEVAAGVFVADRPIGGPLIGVPLYWLGTLISPLFADLEASHGASDVVKRSEYVAHLFVGWRNSLCMALLCWLVVLSARRVGVSRRNAWFAGLALGLTTLAWPQARAWSNAVPAACFLFVAFHLLLRTRERFVRLLRPPRVDLLGVGGALALAILTEPTLALSVAVVAAAFVVSVFDGYRRLAKFALFLRKTWRFGHWIDLTWAALPLALAAGFGFGAMQAHPWPLLPAASEDALGDVVLILASPGRGLVWLAPLVLFAPIGFVIAVNRGARVWPACAVLAVVPVAWAAHPPLLGTWGFGQGALLPALPFLWLGVGVAFDRIERIDWARRAAWALCAFGFVANFAGVMVDSSTYQDLVTQASGNVARPELFRGAAWDPRRAQPWAHWRILRHRMAGLGETFPADEVFFLPAEEALEPHRSRDRGFEHVAWIDLRDRLGGRPYPPVLLALILVGAGCVMGLRALDRALP